MVKEVKEDLELEANKDLDKKVKVVQENLALNPVQNLAQESLDQGNLAQENLAQGNLAQGNLAQKNLALNLVQNLVQESLDQGNLAQENLTQGNLAQENRALNLVKNLSQKDLSAEDLAMEDLSVEDLWMEQILPPGDQMEAKATMKVKANGDPLKTNGEKMSEGRHIIVY